MTSGQAGIVEKLHELELAVSKLYSAYAKKFPELSGFWNSMADEEKEHARIILELPLEVGQDKVFYDKKIFNTAFVDEFLNFLKDEIYTH